MKKGLRIGLEEYRRIYKAGLRAGEFYFLKDLVNQWLEKYPNDIQSTLYKAEIDFAADNY